MKNILLIALAFIVTSSANAIFNPSWERPIYTANLQPVDDGIFYPRATKLTLNKRDGSAQATTLTLVEDTGIRCIQAPCPSSVTRTFRIEKVTVSHHGDLTTYDAVEVLKNIPRNVRIARRTLTLTQSSMELVAPGGHGFMRRLSWDVQVKAFNQPERHYVGTPEGVVTIQSGIN